MSQTSDASQHPSAPSSPSTRPPLVRSRSDRKVAGVAGGIATYLGIDPLILRIVVVVLTLFGGSGLLLYAAGWLLIPDEGDEHSEIERLVGRDRAHGPSVAAIIVTVVGLIVLVTSLGLGRGGRARLVVRRPRPVAAHRGGRGRRAGLVRPARPDAVARRRRSGPTATGRAPLERRAMP